MKTKHLIAALVVLSSFELAAACGPEWTYIGSSPGSTWCIHKLADSPDIVLRGGSDEGAGVYRWSGFDTTWTITGLNHHNIVKIKEFSSFPSQLFAVAMDGLYKSVDNGFTWDLITNMGAERDSWFGDFEIDPHDNGSWFVPVHNAVGERMIVSTDAGVNWRYFEQHYPCFDPMWFQETPGVLYFRETGRNIMKIELEDSTIQSILAFGVGYSIVSAVQHPTQPWIYVLAEGAPGHLVRYNVVSEELNTWIMPDTISCFTQYSYLKYSEGTGLLVGGADPVYLLSDDLQSTQVITGSLPHQTCKQILFANSDLWISEVYGHGLYCRTPIDQSAPEHRDRAATLVGAFPNPFNSTVTIQFNLPAASKVKLEVFNVLGQKVATLANETMNAGSHVYHWSAESAASGVYIYRIEAGKTVESKKMLLLR